MPNPNRLWTLHNLIQQPIQPLLFLYVHGSDAYTLPCRKSWPFKMPILGFETHRNRKYLTRAIKDEPNGDDEGHSSLLLKGYLHDENAKKIMPIHCRRTLDQFSYYMLDSTENRDMDQVIYRWAKKWHGQTPAKDRPILMVDQLWLWVLNDGCYTSHSSAPSSNDMCKSNWQRLRNCNNQLSRYLELGRTLQPHKCGAKWANK
jgi:hypothetical protein